MHAAKRLALASCAGVVIAAALSGPAMADPGGLLSGVTQTLPPVVAEPVEDVGATADALVEQVQAPVDETVQDVTGLVDETVSGVQETVTAPAVSVNEKAEPAAAPTDMPPQHVATAEIVPGAGSTTVARPSLPELEPQRVAPAQQARSRTQDSRPSRSVAPAPRRLERVAAPIAVVESADGSVAGAPPPRESGRRANAPQPQPFFDPSAFGGSVPQPPAPALLIALLLGLLALAAPRAVGRRLHPAVAVPHPADVQFRLVRPG